MASHTWKRGKTFYTAVWDPIRKRNIRKAVGNNKRQAEGEAAKIRVKVSSSSFRVKPRLEAPRLDEFMPRFIDVQYQDKPSYNYAQWCLGRFHNFTGNCRLSDINKGVLQRYVTKRLNDSIHSPYKGTWSTMEKAKKYTPRETRTVSKSTVNREISFIQCMMNRAVEWGELESNPLAGFKKFSEKDKIRKRFLRKEEIEALLLAAESSLNKQLKDIFLLALYIGRRKNEILRLRKQDYDNEKGYLYLGKTKKGEIEQIPVPQTAQEILFHLCNDAGGEWLFPNCSGTGPLRDIDTAFRIACRNAGIKDLVFHHLRHTAISYMVMSGVSPLVIAKLVGHTSPTMVEQRYGHLSEEYKIASSQVFGTHMDKLLRKAVVTAS